MRLTKIPCRQSVEIERISALDLSAIALDLLMRSVAVGSAFFVGLCAYYLFSEAKNIHQRSSAEPIISQPSKMVSIALCHADAIMLANFPSSTYALF